MHIQTDEADLYMPQDVRLCGVCRQWVELSEFRRRTGGGIAHECRDCHNRQRAAQMRRKRAKKRKFDFQSAIAEINDSRTVGDLHAACTALLGLCGGIRGFADCFMHQFNAAPPGSQMRTSMLLAGFRLMVQHATERDDVERDLESLSEDELLQIIAESTAGSPWPDGRDVAGRSHID
jgi:hypothetical protein